MIGPEQQRLMDRLFNDPSRRLMNFNVFPGEERVTAEELCAELNSAFDQVDKQREVDKQRGPVRSNRPAIDVAEMVAAL
jgi:hypothetical protein